MEGSSSFLGYTCCSSPPSPVLKPQFEFASFPLSSSFIGKYNGWAKSSVLVVSCPSSRRSALRTSAFAVQQEAPEKSKDSLSASSTSSSSKVTWPKLDRSGRFCSPRAARELALSIVYAACLEGSDPIRLFDKRVNARREPGYEFDRALLLSYNHMSFGGPPVTVDTVEEADQLLQDSEKESAIEEEILAAPPKLVYSKLILGLTRKLIVAVVERWDSHVLVIDKVVPPKWKIEPAGRILDLCILHLAMSEITVLGTMHQIVINEAVDLAKRFCDGASPRIINGCLRTFVNGLEETGLIQAIEDKRK